MSLVLLLRRLPASSLRLTLLLCLLAPAPMAFVFLAGSARFRGTRPWHVAANVGIALLCLGLHLLLQSRAARRIYAHFEDAIGKTRASIVRLAATSEVPVLRGLDVATIESVVNRDARIVSSAVPNICIAVQFAAIVLVTGSAVSFLSLVAAGLYLGIAVLNSRFRSRLGGVPALLRQSNEPEARFLDVLHDLCAGPRELVLNRENGLAAAAEAERALREAATLRSAAGGIIGASATMSQVFTFLLIVMLRELSLADNAITQVTLELLIILVMLRGYLEVLLMDQEQLRVVGQAARRLLALEAGLATAARVGPSADTFVGFGQINLKGVVLHLPQRESGGAEFVFGPADICLKRGSLTLVHGSNGSGKTTLIEILLGILKPDSGEIQVDGRTIDAGLVEAYRTLFAPVFAHPHLFDRLYGHSAHDPAVAKEWLDRLELPPDLGIDASTRETAALSTGQRKRLALARAIIENRPILILDEYIADQDKSARRQFFDDILPRLKNAGRTVIAVVHEDVRPACADQILHVRDGRLIAEI